MFFFCALFIFSFLIKHDVSGASSASIFRQRAINSGGSLGRRGPPEQVFSLPEDARYNRPPKRRSLSKDDELAHNEKSTSAPPVINLMTRRMSVTTFALRPLYSRARGPSTHGRCGWMAQRALEKRKLS